MDIFRAAQKGLDTQIGGSFYSFDYDLANEYTQYNDSLDSVVYSYSVDVNLYNITDDIFCSTFDLGIEEIIDELEDDFNPIFENYDGVFHNGQIILFGTLDNNDTFTKQTLEDLLIDVCANFRRYDR